MGGEERSHREDQIATMWIIADSSILKQVQVLALVLTPALEQAWRLRVQQELVLVRPVWQLD